MAINGFVYLTDQTPGAPRNSGTNGDLNNLLNWALVTTQGNWVREYNNAGTNESVFRPNTGNRNRLYVRHDSSASGNAQLAVVRGCENASSASVLIDMFPTQGQLANTLSNWRISNIANTTSRPFRIIAWDSGVIYFSQIDNTDYDWGAFLDTHTSYSTDNYATAIIVRGTTTTSSSISAATQTSAGRVSGTQTAFFARDISGLVKSSMASLNASGSFIGNVTGAPAPFGGYLAKLQRERIGLNCSGNQYENISINGFGATALINRGFIPNLWSPYHSSTTGLNNVDTFTDSVYDNTATFGLAKLASSPSTICFILEQTNTWISPTVDI